MVDQGDEEVLPETGSKAFAEAEDELAAIDIVGIFPERLDAFAEDVQIIVCLQRESVYQMQSRSCTGIGVGAEEGRVRRE